MTLDRCAALARICGALLVISNIAWWVSAIGATVMIGTALWSLLLPRR